MADFCKYCGKQLTNGMCTCADFRKAYGEYLRRNGYPDLDENHFIVNSFTPDFSSPSNFIASIKYQSGISDMNSKNGGAYERNVPIVPDCINQEDNEIVVKQYNIAKLRTRLKFMKAEGRLMVTNRRILFRAAGTSVTGNILQEHQFNLDEIGGIEMHKDYRFSFLNLIGCLLIQWLVMLLFMLFMASDSDAVIPISLLLGVIGLVPTFIVYKRPWLKFFFAVISAYAFLVAAMSAEKAKIFIVFCIIASIIMLVDLFIVCFIPNLVIKIKTKGAAGAVVIGSKRSIFRRRGGEDYSGFSEVLPWEDTVMAMNELGTMIDDLQKMGDYAVEKWSK